MISPRDFLRRTAGVLSVIALIGATGCSTQPTVTETPATTKYTLENTDRFILLDRVPVSCTGLMDHPLADGKMEVVANLKNRDNRRIEVQASCVFRTEGGTTPPEETPWQTVTVPENSTITVRFAAAQPSAKKYSVRVRAAR